MDDLISRKASMDLFMGKPPGYYHSSYIVGEINCLPSVEAEPVKRGRWKGYLIPHWTKQYDDDGEPEYKYHAEYVCNICGYNSIIKHNYCPHCGAKMEVTTT